MADPLAQRYGKQAVSVYRTHGDRLFACEVGLMVTGRALEASYTEGDNSLVVATDSMKNFIHRVALEFDGAALEDFLAAVAGDFLDRYDHIDAVEVEGREVVFVARSGAVRQRLYDDFDWARVSIDRASPLMEWSGRKGLHLMKLTGSSFAGFVCDEFTTLPEAHDRPLFVHLDVQWTNSDRGARAPGEQVRDLLVETFAEVDSASIQHLVHEMGVRALERFPGITTMTFEAQNRLWDTVQTSESATVYTDARPPYGMIELTLRR
jgi:urate oxidase / 2-oxo-4-hydroxy-4-carboxy-5-ureidoimidazoline decarboxylase